MLKENLYRLEESFSLKLCVFGGLAVLVFCFLHFVHPSYLISMESQSRQTLLSACASAMTALLGFVITASTILMTLRFEGATRKLAQDGKLTVIYVTFMETIGLLSASTVLSFVCLLLEPKIVQCSWVVELLFGFLAATALKLLTTIFLLKDIGLIHLKDIQDNSKNP